MTLASSWRTKHQRLNLTGEVCPHCGNGAYEQETEQQESLVAMPLQQHVAAD